MTTTGPSRALVFALDISKTNTGLVVLSAPFRYPNGPDYIRVLDSVDIKATAVAQGSQRVWWPTAKYQYEVIKDLIHMYRRLHPDHWACLVYETPAWGSATSEMMVYLQQRLFEYLDADPLTNLDLFGFTAHFARSASRQIFDVPHMKTGKALASAIYKAAWENQHLILGMKEKVSQDIKDAFCLGVSAVFSTTQFLHMQRVGGEYCPKYSASQEYYDNVTEAYPNRLDPFNYKQFLKSMTKRDEQHLTLKNPYLVPVRSLRLHQGNAYLPARQSDFPGYLLALEGGLGKVGGTLYPTLIHDHK